MPDPCLDVTARRPPSPSDKSAKIAHGQTEKNHSHQMQNKIYQVTSHYKKAGAVMLDRFSTQPEAMSFARDAAINHIEPGSGDPLISITVSNRTTNKTLSTFYPDPYEAETLDDDDDG